MTPRSKGKPNFDLSLPCALCGHPIHPNERVALSANTVRCPKCGGSFDPMAGRKPLSTS